MIVVDANVLAFLNNLAYAMGQNRIWQNGCYVGTFSEYDMRVVRRLADESASPATQGRKGS